MLKKTFKRVIFHDELRLLLPGTLELGGRLGLPQRACKCPTVGVGPWVWLPCAPVSSSFDFHRQIHLTIPFRIFHQLVQTEYRVGHENGAADAFREYPLLEKFSISTDH